MAEIELLPYKRDGMGNRYCELFGEQQGWRIFGKHQFDTFDFEIRFADRLILTSAIARYALYAMRPFPGLQPEEVAEDICNDRHPFNVLYKSDGKMLVQLDGREVARATAERTYSQEILKGDIRVFGPLSDGVATDGQIALIENVRSTLEELY